MSANLDDRQNVEEIPKPTIRELLASGLYELGQHAHTSGESEIATALEVLLRVIMTDKLSEYADHCLVFARGHGLMDKKPEIILTDA